MRNRGDWDWEDFSESEVAEMKNRVYRYFPGATLDNDGTFTSAIVTISDFLETIEDGTFENKIAS